MMRYLLALVGLGMVLGVRAEAAGPERPVGQSLVVGLTQTTTTPPSTSLFVVDVATGAVTRVYADPAEGERILLKMGDSDIVGVGRTAEPADVYVMRGTLGQEAAGVDTLWQLRLTDGERVWTRMVSVPLSFSEASPYGLWNRAPEFVVSQAGWRVALAAVRVGAVKMEGPAIRVLSMNGTEEWRIPLPGASFEVMDMAWSPDGQWLAYAVMPMGDEHTLEEGDLPKAGIYLADMVGRSTRLAYPCYGRAVAWGPREDRVTVAVSPRDVWGAADTIRVVVIETGRKVAEFSAPGGVEALDYSREGKWLAAQATKEGAQGVWLYGASGGFAEKVYGAPAGEGRLALLGWVETGQTWTTSRPTE